MNPEANYVAVVQELLGKRADRHGLDSLSPAEQVVLLAVWAQGIVDNGGLQYFYEGASNAAQVADALDALGFREAAEAFRRSLSVFPEGSVPVDHEARRYWLSRNQATTEAVFNDLEAPIIAIGPQLDQAAATYISEHREQFKGIDDLERAYIRQKERSATPSPEVSARGLAGRFRLRRRPRL